MAVCSYFSQRFFKELVDTQMVKLNKVLTRDSAKFLTQDSKKRFSLGIQK